MSSLDSALLVLAHRLRATAPGGALLVDFLIHLVEDLRHQAVGQRRRRQADNGVKQRFTSHSAATFDGVSIASNGERCRDMRKVEWHGQALHCVSLCGLPKFLPFKAIQSLSTTPQNPLHYA
jgi:hypothetical protein